MSLRLITAVALGLTLPHSAMADRRVFAGEEAAALKCAHMFSFTSVVLEAEGMMSTTDKDLFLIYSYTILENYVGGTWDDKMAALDVMSERHGFLGTFEEFVAEAQTCLRQFPV